MTPTHSASRPRRFALVLVAILLGGIFAVGTGVAPAAAHAELLGTTPENGAVLEEAPERAELLFNEPVRLIDGAIHLFPGEGGDPTQLEARVTDTTVLIDLPAELDDGPYALSYRIVSADGHPLGGAITFQIGEGNPGDVDPGLSELGTTPAATEWLVSAVTVVQYLALLVLAGLLFFDRVIQRTGRSVAPSVLLRLAYLMAASSSLLLIPISALRITGADPSQIFFPELWLSGLTASPIIAAGLVTVAGAAAMVLGVRSSNPARQVLAPVFAAGALAAPVLVGHTRTTEPGWAMVAADLGHLAAGAFWTGGMIGLLLYLRAARPDAADAEPRNPSEAAGALVARFSRFALISVLVLAVSGLTMAVLVLDSWDALITTGYGRTLLLKLGMVVPIIALAGWNRTRLLPRILTRPTATLQWASLRRTLKYEAALLVAVIVITGFLTNSSPTHDHGPPVAAQHVEFRVESQGMTLEGTLSPAVPGPNTIKFRLGYDGQAITPEQVTVRARLPEQGLGPFTAPAELDKDTGEYEVTLTMPVPGEWHVQVSARIDTYSEPIAITTIYFP